MRFLPIVWRELRVAARRRGTYWVRTAAALAVIIAGTWLFLMMEGEPARDVSRTLFWVLTGSAVLYALVSGVRATADCLSEEKREGTLGLLFLTDLKGYDVVLGKLVARSLNSFYTVVSVLPVLAIPLLMGGITAGEFWRLALVALNTLFFSLAAGIWVSAMSRSAQRAMGATLLVVVAVTVAGPLWAGMLAARGRLPALPFYYYLGSPAFGYYLGLDQAYRAAKADFWISLLVTHVLGWLCLALASVIVPRAWQERPGGAPAFRWRELRMRWAFGSAAVRGAFRRRLLEHNPFYWLASRMRLKPGMVWGSLVIFAGLWCLGWGKVGRDWLTEGTYVVTALALNLFMRAWFASETVRQLIEERKAGTLELLLSTPLSVREILRGERMALERQFLGPVVAVLAVECVFMGVILSDTVLEREREMCVAVWGGGMLMLVADLVALYWVGLWQALTARNISRASGNSMAIICFLPWGVLALVVSAATFAAARRGGVTEPSGLSFLALWFFVGLVTDLGFSAYARHRLLTGFRKAAQERYGARPGFWRGLLGLRPAAGSAASSSGP